jgi:hypothetical protein
MALSLTPVLARWERENRGRSSAKLSAALARRFSERACDVQLLFPLPAGEGQGEREPCEQFPRCNPPTRFRESIVKVRLATVWFGGCAGCHMSFLDLNEFLDRSGAERGTRFQPGHGCEGISGKRGSVPHRRRDLQRRQSGVAPIAVRDNRDKRIRSSAELSVQTSRLTGRHGDG